MSHPVPDAYWDRMSPTPEEYAAIDLPILTITGYFDGDQLGALAYYRRHMRHGTAAAKARHFLIVGPWDHPGTRTPVKRIGGLEFGDASILDMNALHKEWYDWTLKDGPRPKFLKKRVAYWVMGAEEWKYADDVESIADSTLSLHLDSDGGRAGDVLHSGWLRAAPPAGRTPDAYTYDPLDTSGLALEMRPPSRDYYRDQTPAHNLNGNGLVYHTEPFAEPTEISGTPRLTAWLSMNVPDTDFEVSLYEIRADGSAIYLTDDALRARYRESPRQAKLVVPGEVTKFVFDQFTFFSRQIAKGSRLRLVLRSPNSIAWEKNYNSGGVVARETARDARVARIQLHHDRDRPTTLDLPVVRPESHRLVP
jgi:putative CocE/NonD family hydrolase